MNNPFSFEIPAPDFLFAIKIAGKGALSLRIENGNSAVIFPNGSVSLSATATGSCRLHFSRSKMKMLLATFKSPTDIIRISETGLTCGGLHLPLSSL